MAKLINLLLKIRMMHVAFLFLFQKVNGKSVYFFGIFAVYSVSIKTKFKI